MFEENQRGTLQELADYFREKTVKGEIVIVVEGAEKNSRSGKEAAIED